MPDLDALRAVAARLAAGETGREMDCRIAEAFGWKGEEHVFFRPSNVADLGAEWPRMADLWGVPRFTESLDSAVSLVPDGFEWSIEKGGFVELRFDDIEELQVCVPGKPINAIVRAIVRAEIARLENAGA